MSEHGDLETAPVPEAAPVVPEAEVAPVVETEPVVPPPEPPVENPTPEPVVEPPAEPPAPVAEVVTVAVDPGMDWRMEAMRMEEAERARRDEVRSLLTDEALARLDAAAAEAERRALFGDEAPLPPPGSMG